MASLRYIKHKEINLDKWDKAILNSVLPLVFAQSFYLNATCPDWDALVLGDYDSVFPITRKVKFGYTYLPQPPFTSQLGAFGIVNTEVEMLFYNYILEHFKLIELELNATNELQSDFITVKNTYCIDYKKEYKFNQNAKRNISKAERNGLKVELVKQEDVILLSQQLLNPFLETEVHLSKSTLWFLDNLLRVAMANNALYTYKVIDSNSTIKALGHFISNGKHALFLKGTNFDKPENSGSMHLLIAHAIDFFKDKSLLFDFGGGSNSVGLANFYMGFGGEIMEYSFLRVNRLPWLIKLLKNKK